MFTIGHSDESDGSETNSLSTEELMSLGFSAKEQCQYDEALSAFVSALAANSSASAVPYLIIEIGSLLKSKGSYDDAILLFSNGQKLPALMRNQSLQREFLNMIAYLRITKNTLLAKQLALIPFSQIPCEVVAEIDANYTEWNKLEEAI